MKKMLLIIATLSCVMAGEMGLSAYGGLGLTNTSIGTAGTGSEYGMKPGLTFGVQYYKLPVVLGLGISMRGSKISVDSKEVGSMNYTYLDISALYPYAVGPGNAYAGLVIGMNLAAEMVPDTGEATDLKASDCKSCMNNLDYGIALGYTYPINEDMGVSLGYYLGLADFSGDYEMSSDPSADKHNGILMTVGYALPF